ncbi:hypothetical protein, partial [Thermoleptolyngbya sp.]
LIMSIYLINPGFWIGDFGLLIQKFARLPAIESVALFPRIDIRSGLQGLFAERMVFRTDPDTRLAPLFCQFSRSLQKLTGSKGSQAPTRLRFMWWSDDSSQPTFFGFEPQ